MMVVMVKMVVSEIASQSCNLKREDWHRGMEDFNRLNCYKYTKREGTNTEYSCYKYTLIVYKYALQYIHTNVTAQAVKNLDWVWDRESADTLESQT